MNEPGVPGIKLFTPLDADGSKWREQRLSAEEVAAWPWYRRLWNNALAIVGPVL